MQNGVFSFLDQRKKRATLPSVFKSLIFMDLFGHEPELIFQDWENPRFEAARVRVSVLRSDLVHPWIQGNKWYKLKFYLEQLQRNPEQGIVSVGGPFSNHLIALSCAAAGLKRRAFFFLRGDENEWGSNPAVLQMRRWGAKLIPVSRSDFRKIYTTRAGWKDFFPYDPEEFLFVPMGGSSPDSLASVAGWAGRISEVERFDSVVLPAASAGTVSGFAAGLSEGTALLAIEVLRSGGGLATESENLIAQSGLGQTVKPQWISDYHFGGYARSTPELLEFCRAFNRTEKFHIEPVYSGKAFFAVSDLIEKGYFKEESKILVVHTGGIFPWNLELLGTETGLRGDFGV
jgi:1-aminocyclopropane-1-carboxylate deaminase